MSDYSATSPRTIWFLLGAKRLVRAAMVVIVVVVGGGGGGVVAVVSRAPLRSTGHHRKHATMRKDVIFIGFSYLCAACHFVAGSAGALMVRALPTMAQTTVL